MATPRGIRNNNPLNIRKGNNWQGERHPQTDSSFEEFTSMIWGLRAGFLLLKRYMSPGGYNCHCIQDIIERWAPPTENATVAYIKAVCDNTGLTARQPIYYRQKGIMCKLVYAMCRVECGQIVPFDMILQAYDLASH